MDTARPRDEFRRWIATGQARHLCVDAGLSQSLIARDCEITASAVHRWEVGDRLPRGRNIVAYHSFLTRPAALTAKRDDDGVE